MSTAGDTPEDYQFMPRLLGSYLLALVAYMAFGKSLYIEVVSIIAWVVTVVHLFRRFGRRGLWALLATPWAFYWAWEAWGMVSDPVLTHPEGAIIV